mgnify:CR=1 FL=1
MKQNAETDSAVDATTTADAGTGDPFAPAEDHQTSTDETLPVPASIEETDLATRSESDIETHSPRLYVEIRPTETPLSQRAVGQAMDHCHALLERASKTGLRDRLTGSTRQPSVEWLLVSDGKLDTSIRYLVGVTDESLHDDLKRVLRTCLPNSYECTTVEYHPGDRMALERTRLRDLYAGTVGTGKANTGETTPVTPTPALAGVQYFGETDRPSDWQTPLTTFDELTATPRHEPRAGEAESRRLPLTTLVETMRDVDAPVIYQVLCKPYPEWTASADEYRRALSTGTASLSGKLWDEFRPRSREERDRYEPPPTDQERIDALSERETRRGFQVTARAIALPHAGEPTSPPAHVADSLATTVSPVSGPHHRIEGELRADATADDAGAGTALFEALCSREHESVAYDRAWNRFRRRFRSAGLLVTPAELPGLCVLDGSALTPTGKRALGIRHRERTGIALPPPSQLRRYRPPGMALVRPLSSDREPLESPVFLPKRYQPRHQVVVGDTGAGKSVLLLTALLSNHQATAGPEILFDYKGGGTALEYLRSHYQIHGSLDDVVYFDLTSVLPAFSFFDIEPLLKAGLPREEARSRKTGHYEEILRGAMPADQYDAATESPKVIRNHLRALYDPVHGSNAFTHATLYEALQRTQGNETPPPVSEDTFETYFAGLLERDRDVLTKVLGGALSRVETIATDARLAPLFNHVSTDEEAATFEFGDVIDENSVVIFDFGGMETRIKRTLTLVLLSNLWTALKARQEATPSEQETPQVNLYLEEARDVAATELVDTLLSQGRSFDLSVTLGVQFLEQLDSPDPANNTYREALNETATFVVGNVAVDRDLPSVLATDAMSPSDVERRLAALRRGEWLVRPGAGFGESTVRPFLGESLPAPPGHPASADPLQGVEREGFRDALERVQTRTAATAGIELTEPSTPEMASAVGEESESETLPRVDSLLPYTQRMPACVRYDPDAHAICCAACETRHNSDVYGLIQAIQCCHSTDAVDIDDIPICDLNLKLSPEEARESAYTPRQLCFMQAVYNAQQNRYESPEYDLVRDSMVRIQEYTGIETDAIDNLVDEGLVHHDTDRPHRLYSLRPAGRAIIEESHQHGIAYGHGEGDLDESSEHVLGVEIAIRWLTQEFAEDSDSDVVTVHPYYDLREGSIDAGAFFGDGDDVDDAIEGFEHHRLDVVGLDADGEIVVTMEVERINHDTRRAVPEDYDKMAACEPEDAIWMTMSHAEAHEILGALNNPLEGEPRVEKTYSENSPASAFRIDQPGFTDIYTLDQLRGKVLDEGEH